MRKRKLHQPRCRLTPRPDLTDYSWLSQIEDEVWLIGVHRRHCVRVNSALLLAYGGRPPRVPYA